MRHAMLRLPGLLLCCTLLAWAEPARSADPEATNAEMLEQVGKAVDAGTDAVGLLYESQPKLFANLKDTVTALKVVDLLASAKDTEALTEIVTWQANKQLDSLLEKLLPGPAMTVLTAVKAYKGALEVVRDVMVVPAMDDRLYAAYKARRQGAGGASPEDAFTEVTVLPASGYYLVKPAMLDKYYKAKGWNKDAVGGKMQADAERRLDAFWNKRLEARYQAELLREQAKAVRDRLWSARAGDLAAIRAALASAGPGGPFVTKAEVAGWKGWHFSGYTYWPPSIGDPFTPQQGQNGEMTQSFFLQKDGFTEKKDAKGYPAEYGQGGRLATGTARAHVVIHTWPRRYSITHNGQTFTLDQLETVKQLAASLAGGQNLTPVREISRPGIEYGVLYARKTPVEVVYFFDGVSAGHRIQLSAGYTVYNNVARVNFDESLMADVLATVAGKAARAKP